MFKQQKLFFVSPSVYFFVFFNCLFGSVVAMFELSKERQEWFMKVHDAIPENLKVMNEVEKTAAQAFVALAQDNYSEIDDRQSIRDFDNAVRASSRIASSIRTMSQDCLPKFQPAWHSKQGKTKYAQDTKSLLNNPSMQKTLHENYSKKSLNLLKKKYTKGKKQLVCAHWMPTNLPKEKNQEAFWNPSAAFTAQDDLDVSLVCKGAKQKLLADQQKKVEQKENDFALLKQAALKWKREDDKDDAAALKDGQPTSEQKFEMSFTRVLHRYNIAMMNAAFYLKEFGKKKKDIQSMLHALYKAQAIKNALLSSPEYHQAKDRNSIFYTDIYCSDLADDLYTVHSFLADEKEYQVSTNTSLSTTDWIIFACKLGKTILNNPETIKDLLKQDSMHEMLNSEVMKRYAADAWIHTILSLSSRCVDFFDNHSLLKTIISPFGKYLIRPTLKGIISCTKHTLERKSHLIVNQTCSLQNSLDAYAISLRDEYQSTRKMSSCNSINNSAREYVEFLLGQTSLNDDSFTIPLSKIRAKILKEKSQKRLTEIQEELKVFRLYCSSGYQTTSEDEQMLEVFHEEEEDLKEKIKYANYWLQFYGERVQKRETDNVVHVDVIRKEHEERNQKLSQQDFSEYETGSYDPDKSHDQRAKEKMLFTVRLEKSKVYFTPEDFLFPKISDSTTEIRQFIKKHSEEYRKLFDQHKKFLDTLSLSPETFLNLFIKAKLNKECEPLISHYENIQSRFRQKLYECKRLLDEQEKLKKASGNFFQGSFEASKSFFVRFYSFLVFQVTQWRLHKNMSAHHEEEQNREELRKNLRQLKKHREYRIFDQMFHDKSHFRYVQDESLEKKTHLLAQIIDPIFEYALYPTSRLEQQPKSHEGIKKRNHRSHVLMQPLTVPLYENIIQVKVPQQNGSMDCALRALINVNYLLEQNQNEIIADDNYNSKLAWLRNSSSESQWLKEDSVKDLIAKHFQEKNLIFIPSVYYLHEMRSCLDRDVLEQLSCLQQKLKSEQDFSQGIIIGNMRQNGDIQNDGHCDHGHYVVLVVQRLEGVVKVKFANSLRSYSCQEAVSHLLDVIRTYDFTHVIDEKNSSKVCDVLCLLDFRKVFVDKKLHRDITQTSPEGLLQNTKELDEIIDDLLDAASELLHLTNGKAMWTNSGYKDTKALILETLDILEHSHGVVIKVYPRGVEQLVMLNDVQKESIEVLRYCIAQLQQ